MRLESSEVAIEELAAFARAGGDTVVDVISKNVGADPQRIRPFARAVGL